MTKIQLICEKCSDTGYEPVMMELEGHLFFNTEKKVQSQGYICPKCHHPVTIVVYT